MQILEGHQRSKAVCSLAFSPNGTRLASVGRDYRARLWDLAAGTSRVERAGGCFSVAFATDGETLAIGGTYDFRLWRTDTGLCTGHHIPTTYGEHQGFGWDVAYSPDGSRLAAVSGVVRLFDAATLASVPLPADVANFASNCLAFSRGGTLATGHTVLDKCVRLWDAATGQYLRGMGGSTATLEALAFSPDGRRLAGCAASSLLVWDVASGEIILRRTIGKQHFKGVAFSPDGRLLAFARNDATVTFLDAGDWRELAAYDWKVGPIVSLAFAPDGMRVAAGSGKGKIVVFDVDL